MICHSFGDLFSRPGLSWGIWLQGERTAPNSALLTGASDKSGAGSETAESSARSRENGANSPKQPMIHSNTLRVVTSRQRSLAPDPHGLGCRQREGGRLSVRQ